MNEFSKFYQLVGDMSEQIRKYQKEEAELSKHIVAMSAERRRAQVAIERIEASMAKLIVKHSATLQRRPKTKIKRSKTGAVVPQIIGSTDQRNYITKRQAIEHIVISDRKFEDLYKNGKIEVYQRQKGPRFPYLFLLSDVVNIKNSESET